MKAKLKTAYFLNSETAIVAGTECVIIDSWCGTDGYYYLCDFGNGDIYPINGVQLETTDRRPIVNWVKLRITFASNAMRSLLSNPNLRFDTAQECAEMSVMAADALIEELKKEKK